MKGMQKGWATIGAIALACGIAAASHPAAAQGTDAKPQAKEVAKGGPNDRYRFYEKYALKPQADEISSYRVGFRETIKVVIDAAAGGAPERKEFSRAAVWTESPAQLGGLNQDRVMAVVRHTEKIRANPDPRLNPNDPPLLESTDLFVRLTGGYPQVLILAPARSLRVEEYRFLSMCPFVPDLGTLLPEGAVHLQDTWAVNRSAVQTLVSGVNGAVAIAGKLDRIEPTPDGKQKATFEIRGTAQTAFGEAQVRAEADFLIEKLWIRPAPAGTKTAQAAGAPLQAQGVMVRLSLAQEDLRVPVGEGRRKQDIRREVLIERQLQFDGEPPKLPAELPRPTAENSWLLFHEPKGKFQVRYPQEMRGTIEGPNEYSLQRTRREGEDRIRIKLTVDEQPKPDQFIAELKARWADLKVQAQSGGPAEALPEDEWLGMKVYRGDALLRLPQNGAGLGIGPNGASRLFFYGYAIQTGTRYGMKVEASTTSDPSAPFRDEVEAILKTLKFGDGADAGLGKP
ncbi:MAG: hypothetical protein U0800_23290 [Isosphaeraceae bacterium]